MATEFNLNSDDWEVVHDDGFVYKRKKRRLDPSAFTRKPDPVPDPDPALELKERKRRKTKILLQLKDKYQKEILLWEHLSNTLKAMDDRHSKYQNPKDGETGRENGAPGFDFVESQSSSFLSDVFLQVEAQEAVIRDCTQLCEVAESLCSAHEENAKQQFVDLSIWKSPLELMTYFSEA